MTSDSVTPRNLDLVPKSDSLILLVAEEIIQRRKQIVNIIGVVFSTTFFSGGQLLDRGHSFSY